MFIDIGKAYVDLMKNTFFSGIGVKFSDVLEKINGGNNTVIFIIAAFLIVLFFKNSNELINNEINNYNKAIFVVAIFVVSVLFMQRVSEFLYFNF